MLTSCCIIVLVVIVIVIVTITPLFFLPSFSLEFLSTNGETPKQAGEGYATKDTKCKCFAFRLDMRSSRKESPGEKGTNGATGSR